ncbi:MAG: amidohydrolase family protein [Pseudomonadales bacterium]
MPVFCRILALLVVSLFLSASNFAEESKEVTDNNEEKWDVLNPPFALNEVEIDTQTTTWSSLDVTPDGKQIVFDMLGDIFIVGIEGGDAKALTQDLGWNIHPSVSPDGQTIAFISDRGGLSNIWAMDLNGQNMRAISEEKKNLIHSPKWSPDGDYLIANKGIMSRRSIPAGEIWLYHKNGGDGVPLKERNGGKKEQKNIADPAFSHDGNYVYYTQDLTPGSTFSYNRDPLKGVFGIQRYDMSDGEETTVAGGVGGAIVPSPSPDGKKIAFIRRIREKTALFIKDLESGTERAIYTNLERDMQEGFGSEGYFAYFDWTPDAGHIVFWSGGGFHKINVTDGAVQAIPVRVKSTLRFADAQRVAVDVAPDQFDLKMTRWAQKSPNGKSILFQALGKLYVHDIGTGKSKRLTRQNDHDEFYPRYSADGRKIIYTSWNDETLGSIKVVASSGGNGKTISMQPGHYVEPSFAADGKTFAYRKFSGGYLLSPEWSLEPGVYVASISGEEHRRISSKGHAPQFIEGSERIFFTEFIADSPYPETQLVSVNAQGNDRREHLYGADKVSEYRLSPDGKWVTFAYQFKAYVAPFTASGKRREIGPNSKSFTVTQLSDRAGEFLHWDKDSTRVGWSYGPNYYERVVAEASIEEPKTVPAQSLSFKVDSDQPSHTIALVNATVVTMRDANSKQEVLQDAAVLLDNNRIAYVGSMADANIPENALVISAEGKTIIPGLVDAHAHGSMGSEEIIPQQNWMQYSNLAFGVTSIHDPSNDTSEIFAAAEMQKAGMLVAPRIYSTGSILYGAESLGVKAIVDNYDDALFHMQRMKDVGAISVKSYNQPRRDQRQQILAAARELDMMVVPEGGGKLHQNISMLIDGHTGLEHSLPIPTGYQDLTTLWSATKFGYTPTFVVSYGGLMGEEYWYDRHKVWENPRLLRYTPHYLLDSRSIRRPKAPDEQYNHFNVAKYAKQLRDKGVTVHIGAHGQREGLGAHWEMWIMQQGGFSAWEALRAGTIDGATHLGMDKHIGSIEVGKLADLVLIDGDVLSDLSLSEYVSHTIINGRVYEVSTMNEVGGKHARQPFFFEQDNAAFLPPASNEAQQHKAHKHHWQH